MCAVLRDRAKKRIMKSTIGILNDDNADAIAYAVELRPCTGNRRIIETIRLSDPGRIMIHNESEPKVNRNHIRHA